MIRIELTPYEQKDLLEVLDFALKEYEYQRHFEKRGTSGYWVYRIPELKKVILGKVNPPSLERR